MTEAEWPLWAATHPQLTPTCPHCGQPVAAEAAFCEACGTTLEPTAPPTDPTSTTSATTRPTPSEASTQTRRLGVRHSQLIICPSCAGTIDADGYCQTCGAKAPSARDHFFQTPSAWVAGVSDRGVVHSRNEDALALWSADDKAILVVCDGVSSSIDSDAASMAAAVALRDHLAEALASMAQPSDETEAAAQIATALVAATAVANAAVVEGTSPDSTNAASATMATAVILGDEVHFANLGDSRVYFLGTDQQLLLSLDDSMAQAFIAQGMDRAEAEALPRAHAITKWLGRDAIDVVPRVGSLRLTEPGWVVVCSDGLWNYASSPAQLAEQLRAAAQESVEPLTVAENLVRWASAQGGRDNITVAVARYPGLSGPTTLSEDHPTHTDDFEERPENG